MFPATGMESIMKGWRQGACWVLFFVMALSFTAPAHAQQRTTPKEAPGAHSRDKAGTGVPAHFASSGWQVRCSTVGKKVACLLTQAIVEMRTRRSLVVLTIPGNRKAMTLRLPHGLDLRVPAIVTVDGRELGKATFVTSRPNGAYATFPLGKSVLGKLREGKMLGIRMKVLNANNMDVRMDLRGFTAALKKLGQ